MEMSRTAIVVAFAFGVAAIAIWIWRVVNWVWLKPKRLEAYLRGQGLSGTPYKFLVGDVRREVNMMKKSTSKPISLTNNFTPRVEPFLIEAVKDHGKSSFMWTGPTPTVIIRKPDHIKEIFNKVYNFQKPPLHPILGMMVTGVATFEGDKWTKHRRIMNPAFFVEKLKYMVPAFYESCSKVVSKWEMLVNEDGSSGEIDVWPFIESMTADAISRTAFGSNYEEGKRVFELQEEQAKRVIQALQMGFIPGWRSIPTKNNLRMKAIDREMKERLTKIIKKREREMELGEAPKDDILGLLLESNPRDDGLGIEDIIEECRLIYFAGQETTASLLGWTMILLSWHQDWQARAREEVLQVLGQNKPDFEKISRLKIVTMILNEVLRLYPPAVGLQRYIDKETKVEDITLPAGVNISVPVVLVHHDPDLWGEDALEFKPERFANGLAAATKNQVTFIPFGWGPRLCPGMNIALTEAKTVLCMILQRFSFELSPSYIHAPRKILTLHPQFGAPLIFRKL